MIVTSSKALLFPKRNASQLFSCHGSTMIITIQDTQRPLAQFPIWELSMPTRDVSTDWMLILQMHGFGGWLVVWSAGCWLDGCWMVIGFVCWLLGLFVGFGFTGWLLVGGFFRWLVASDADPNKGTDPGFFFFLSVYLTLWDLGLFVFLHFH